VPVALCLSLLGTIGGLALVAPALAADNTLRIEGPVIGPVPGGPISVRIVGSASIQISGVAATVAFDNTHVHITSIAKGADWVGADASWAGYPSEANMAAFITDANRTGTIPRIAADLDGSRSLAPGEHDFLSVTFEFSSQRHECRGFHIGRVDGGFRDGRAGSYGRSLTTTSVDGWVGGPCENPIPPSGSLRDTGVVNVSGSLLAGFLGLRVPTGLIMRVGPNMLYTASLPVTVLSDVAWDLRVDDPKNTDKGHMTDGRNVLSRSLSAASTTAVNLRIGGLVATGADTVTLGVTLAQFVDITDQPGSYSIGLVFQAISAF
jgi:hypothetical protein